MSNKNRHVIIAYFANVDAAGNAAAELKEWDKANDAVKLGGVGILHWEDGKIKTKKVGARAAGKGAAWGTALGATVENYQVPAAHVEKLEAADGVAPAVAEVTTGGEPASQTN